MIFEQLSEGNCRTYLVADAGDAILVDPLLGREDHYLAALKSRGLALKQVLDTHVHADHLSACALLRDRTGADHGVHAASRVAEGNLRVEEGQRLQVGAVAVDILHTPGHTPDSMTLRLPDRLLTGDFLFLGEGGAGRTDLPGGDPSAHWDSIRKLEGLDGDLLIFPGHDYHGRTSSTLAEERKVNPRLQPRSREAYAAWLTGMQMPPADWMKAVVQANLTCARDARGVEIPVGGAVCEVDRLRRAPDHLRGVARRAGRRAAPGCARTRRVHGPSRPCSQNSPDPLGPAGGAPRRARRPGATHRRHLQIGRPLQQGGPAAAGRGLQSGAVHERRHRPLGGAWLSDRTLGR